MRANSQAEYFYESRECWKCSRTKWNRKIFARACARMKFRTWTRPQCARATDAWISINENVINAARWNECRVRWDRIAAKKIIKLYRIYHTRDKSLSARGIAKQFFINWIWIFIFHLKSLRALSPKPEKGFFRAGLPRAPNRVPGMTQKKNCERKRTEIHAIPRTSSTSPNKKKYLVGKWGIAWQYFWYAGENERKIRFARDGMIKDEEKQSHEPEIRTLLQTGNVDFND